jgi:hypothetical protein
MWTTGWVQENSQEKHLGRRNKVLPILHEWTEFDSRMYDVLHFLGLILMVQVSRLRTRLIQDTSNGVHQNHCGIYNKHTVCWEIRSGMFKLGSHRRLRRGTKLAFQAFLLLGYLLQAFLIDGYDTEQSLLPSTVLLLGHLLQTLRQSIITTSSRSKNIS